MAAVAAVLVVVIGAGALVYSGVGRGGAGSTAATGGAAFGSEPLSLSSPGAFGKLPAPGLPGGNTDRPTTVAPQSATSPGAAYTGPVALKWTGTLNLTISTPPGYRYHEPTPNTAAQFPPSLGTGP